MARRVMLDLPIERAAAWQAVLAEDPQLRRRLGVYVIRRAGEHLPVGSKFVGSSFDNDAERNAVMRSGMRDGYIAYGYIPRTPAIQDMVVSAGRVGCLFISDRYLNLASVRARVDEYVAIGRAAYGWPQPDVAEMPGAAAPELLAGVTSGDPLTMAPESLATG